MQIEYIGHVLPARRITNDDVVDLIREHSAGFEGDLTQQMRVIKSLLHLTGARTRYWLADKESPRGLIRPMNSADHRATAGFQSGHHGRQPWRRAAA